MALFINGVGQDTFSMNGVSIDNLYVNDVLVWSLDTSIAPDAPTDFVASDDLVGEITFSWTNSTIGDPTPTYDIYISGGALVVSGVTSPHTEAIVAGTADYIVRAVNSEGTADSNVDSGTSISGNTKPVITRIGNASITITEGDTYVDQGATALDAEDGDITSDIVTVNPVDPDTVGSYTVTYNVTDSEGLAADEVTRSVEVEAVVITDDPPIYLMTEPLEIPGDGFDYLFNSADSGTKWDGKLLTSGDTAWNPSVAEYPEDGTIDFGTNKADTQWVMPQFELLTFTFIDSVENNSYRMISLVPQGDGATANVLYDAVLDPVDTGLNYTAPLTPFVLDDRTALTGVPSIPTCVVTMSQYTFGAGDTATVTFTHNVDVVGFAEGKIDVPNGTLSNWTEVAGNVYTATFTPDADVSDDTNVITTLGSQFLYYDNHTNQANADFSSANYTVNTVDDNLLDNGDFTNGTTNWIPSNTLMEVIAHDGHPTALKQTDDGSAAHSYNSFEAVSGTNYTLEYDYINPDSSDNNAKVTAGTTHGQGGNYLDYTDYTNELNMTSFEHRIHTFTATQTGTCYINLVSTGIDHVSLAWFDNVSVVVSPESIPSKVHFSFGEPNTSTYPLPAEIQGYNFLTYNYEENPVALVDQDNEATGWTATQSPRFGSGTNGYTAVMTGNGGFMADAFMAYNWNASGDDAVVTLQVDAGGTYTITATGSTNLTGDNRVLGVTVTGQTKHTVITAQNYTEGVTITGVQPIGTEITIAWDNPDTGLAYASGFTIERTS